MENWRQSSETNVVATPNGDFFVGFGSKSYWEAFSKTIDSVEVLFVHAKKMITISLVLRTYGRATQISERSVPCKTCPCAFYPTRFDKTLHTGKHLSV